jgi:hypothetical protein
MSYNCNICNKEYKSYGSLWNHNKLKHNNIQITQKIYKYNCDICDKKFTRKSNLDYHYKKSCEKHNIILNENKLLNETINLQKKIDEMDKKIKSLEGKNYIINNGTINNGPVNIININKVGSENVLELNDYEINEIFNKELSGIVSLIKFINFNKRLPNNHSFCTKSLEGKYLLTYNTEEEKIESVRKKYFYQELLDNSIKKMEILYKSCKNKFSKKEILNIEETLQHLKEIKNRDFSDKVLKEIKNKLVEISYNFRSVVLNTWNNPNNIIKSNNKNNDVEIIKKLSEYDTSNNLCDDTFNDISNYFISLNSSVINTEDSDTESDNFI